MKKLIFATIIAFFCIHVHASPDLSHYFQGKTGCFLLYDVNAHKIIANYNTSQCKKRIAPQSTFKVALSLMAFDQGIITQDTVFKWDGQDRGTPKWNHDQTPKTWLSDSVIWVSQQLTPKLGLEKIQHYLHAFHYGNEDFSGDPGKNNGLERAWLTSSLKISADEQLAFLTAFVAQKLPVSLDAISATKQNMYLETLPNGWKLYGKTGSTGISTIPNVAIGWFVGWIEKSDQTYIFVTDLTDTKKNPQITGVAAKTITQQILAAMEI